MQLSEFAIKDIKMKNDWLMSAHPLGFVNPAEWMAFYMERAKDGVAAISFSIEEILQMEKDVVRSCLVGLKKLGCVPFLQFEEAKESLKKNLDLAKELDFLGVIVEVHDKGFEFDIFKQIDDLIVIVAASYCDEEVLLKIEQTKEVIHAICIMDFINIDVKSEIQVEQIKFLKNRYQIPILWMADVRDSRALEEIVCINLFDGIFTWKPYVCDGKFISKISKGQKYKKCQECGWCDNHVPVICPYHPEIGSEYFESLRRKIATRKEFCICGNGIVALYAAKKAAERGFPVSLCQSEEKSNCVYTDMRLLEYRDVLEEELEDVGVQKKYVTGSLSEFLKSRKPYYTMFFQSGEEVTDIEETMFSLLDERLSCGKFLDMPEREQIEISLMEVYQFFKQFYLV